MKKINALSVCSGAGGSELFLDKRVNIVGFSEIKKSALSLLRYHHPKANFLGDIKNIPYLDINLLIGGTPCQNLSSQGDGTGIRGDKSIVFFEYVGLLKRLTPEYFLWENVKRTIHSNNGEDFKIILQEFKEAGYEIQYKIFNAKDFGTIQARERIFIFGTRKDIYSQSSKKLDSVIYGGKKYQKDKNKEIIAYSKSTRDFHYDYRIREDGLVNTLTTGKGCGGKSTCNYIYENKLLRLLTPEECEKLMTWPKNYTKYGRDLKGNIFELSEKQRFDLIGNGIVSTIPQEIINQLILDY